jgi:RNA polymerase sigma-70 factor (ECF subfamily)
MFIDNGLSAFQSVRPRLFGIAYRMLGSAAEAEDLVQDVWLRWQQADRSVVRDAAAFLTTTATRLAINVMQSARSRRETCVGAALPERVDPADDPRSGAERGQALAFALRWLLETLTHTERAAFILREAFDYPYRDIATLLRLEEANARQLVARARLHVTTRQRTCATSIEQRRLLDAFTAAARHGEVDGLEGLLASTAVTTQARLRSRVVERPALERPAPERQLARLNSERTHDHETRHHRRHWTHWIEAGHQIEGARP